jgi:hypothetical protein
MKLMYIPREKKNRNVVNVEATQIGLPSQLHKFGALKNKSQVFDDRRKRKPKYKPNYMED